MAAAVTTDERGQTVVRGVKWEWSLRKYFWTVISHGPGSMEDLRRDISLKPEHAP